MSRASVVRGARLAGFVAVALAFAALAALQWYGDKVSGDAVRALADFALFTPLPVLGVQALARW